jgi:hypothetical protein
MIRALSTTYASVRFRSRAEARWALFFDAVGLKWQYEFEGFELRSGCYLVDFWLPDVNLYVEVKGREPTDVERARCADLAQATEADVLIAVGNPEERFQLLWFDRAGEREARYVWARDYHARCGFWLVAEDSANWIGPDRTRGHVTPRGPMLSGALEEAYELARSARFDRRYRAARQQPIAERDPERERAA